MTIVAVALEEEKNVKSVQKMHSVTVCLLRNKSNYVLPVRYSNLTGEP